MNANFNDYANYYDLLYADKNYQEEALHIDSLIRKFSHSPNSILELGCGTGKHAEILASMGYNLTCIDRSQEMIAQAKTNTNPSLGIAFKTGDIRNWRGSKQYDCVISLFHVLSYQVSNEDLVKSIKNFASNLENEGILIFDFWYGPAVLNIQPSTRIKRLQNDSVSITRIAEPTLHTEQNSVDVNYDILVQNNKTKALNQFAETHPMRYFFLPELTHLLNSNGLTLLNSFEWMSQKELSNQTWSGVIVARKTNENIKRKKKERTLENY